MVLALAIVHHLALGQGLSLSDIVQTLSRYVNKCLVVEFVAIDDQLIVNEPSFFPALQANPDKFGWYTLENLTKELELEFRHVEIKQSYPESRALLVCTK